jgi:hypothetical protein
MAALEPSHQKSLFRFGYPIITTTFDVTINLNKMWEILKGCMKGVIIIAIIYILLFVVMMSV